MTAVFPPDLMAGLSAIADAPARAQLPTTDLGNAQRLVHTHGEDIRFVPGRGWLVWDTTRWAVDETGEIKRRAKLTARALLEEARVTEDAHRRERLARWSATSENVARIRAMIELAESEQAVAVAAADLDADPWLLTLENGTIDLRTGNLREHRRADLITMLAPVSFDPMAHCPTWEKFVVSVAGGNLEIAAFLRRAIGYTLTGSAQEEIFFLTYGPAATGKSTFLEAIKSMLGPYAMTADADTLLRRRGDAGPRNDLARLAGARMVAVSEIQANRAFDEATMKSITGGDTITARLLYKEPFEYRPGFTLWIATNSRPAIDADDTGMWRRVCPIAFENAIPEDQRDPRLKQTLTTNADSRSAILNWAIDGCQAWQKNGLGIPDVLLRDTEAYRAENDDLGDWFEAECIFNSTGRTLARDLHDCYRRYCFDQRTDAVSSQEFGRRLRAKSCEKSHLGGQRAWKGIELRSHNR